MSEDVEYSCNDCYKKPGARKRLVPYDEWEFNLKYYCILCGKEMAVYTGINDKDLDSLTGKTKGS